MEILGGKKKKKPKKKIINFDFFDEDIDDNFFNNANFNTNIVTNDQSSSDEENKDEMSDEEEYSDSEKEEEEVPIIENTKDQKMIDEDEDPDEVEFLGKRSRPTDEIIEENISDESVGDKLLKNVKNGFYDNVYLMLKERVVNHCGIDHTDSKGVTLLMHACQRGDEKMVRLLLTEGADSNKLDKGGRSSIFYGIKFEEITKMLVLNGCCRYERKKFDKKEDRVFLADNTGKTFMQVEGITEETKRFINFHEITIFEALITQDCTAVKQYFTKGYLVNQTDNTGRTLMEILFATKIKTRNVIEISKLLIKYGANSKTIL